jgi:hypothetical protein
LAAPVEREAGGLADFGRQAESRECGALAAQQAG